MVLQMINNTKLQANVVYLDFLLFDAIWLAFSFTDI